MYRYFVKRLLDLILSLAGLIVLSPLFILIMLILLFVNQGKPFFMQRRVEKKGRIFNVVKFRTMIDKKDENGDLLPDKDRLTSFGEFIRRTSLDEIPQLLNVIAGNMSLVGPRPLLVDYLSLYSEEQARRHDVLPGITGWAQIHGRNTISWKRKFEYDIWYVDHISFILDMKILFITFVKVFQQDGINASSNTTMPFFNGNN
jgi:Sugar transferases involved in lipopolysaccharide synthesis